MIRAALLAMALVSATSAGRAFAASGREVLDMDGGPGDRMVIVRNGGEGDGAWWSDGRDVLDYTDATGARVRVYADHPVARSDVEARLSAAEHEGEEAREEGRRAGETGRRVALEDRRNRREAQQPRAGAPAEAY